MQTIVRTIYGSHLQSCELLKRPFTVLPNSTINEKFNVFPAEIPATNEYPSLTCIALGNKGVTYEVGTNNFILTNPVPHLPSHAGLYNYLPFIARLTTADLTPAERTNYRMRVLATVGGVNYVFYYLKVLPITNVVPTVVIRNVVNGVITATPFVPSVSDLAPAQVVLPTTTINNPNGDYLVSTSVINFSLNQNDVNEIINAATILYNDPRYAVISEIALCTGIDRTLSGTFGATTAPYIESVVTQIAAFIHQYHSLTSTTTGVQIEFDVGAVEPLLI